MAPRTAKRPSRAGAGKKRPRDRPDPVASARLSPLLRPLERTVKSLPPRPADAPPRVSDPVSLLLAETARLQGPRRVPKNPERGTADGGHPSGEPTARSGVGRAGPRFVVKVDLDGVEAFRTDVGPRALAPLRRQDWAPQERIDLHGRRAYDLMRSLHGFVRDCVTRGIVRVLVIHGKGLHSTRGVGVLGELTRDALAEDRLAPFVRAFLTARPALGGLGAVCVELERQR